MRRPKVLFRALRAGRGSAALLLALFFPVFMCAVSMSWDLGRLYAAKIAARHALNLAVRAAAAEVDQAALSDPAGPRAAVDPGRARASFDAVLAANVQPYLGGLFSGPPRVLFFAVVNAPADAARLGTPAAPWSYSVGGRTVTLAQAAAAAEIAVPVRLGPFGRWAAGRAEVEVLAHAAAAPELRL